MRKVACQPSSRGASHVARSNHGSEVGWKTRLANTKGREHRTKPSTCWCKPRQRTQRDYLDYDEEEDKHQEESDGAHALSELIELTGDEPNQLETETGQERGWRKEERHEGSYDDVENRSQNEPTYAEVADNDELSDDEDLDMSVEDGAFSWEQWEVEETAMSSQFEFASMGEQAEEAERALLVGVSIPQDGPVLLTLEETMEELGKLAHTAGLQVVGSITQKLQSPNPKTFIGKGKVQEMLQSITSLDIDVIIFDEELSPRQLRNLEKILAKEQKKTNVRICDRTNLILDIFSQRARTKEGRLQVDLAQAEYQLPRLTKMWTHLERQQGGAGIRGGMGEKQLEVDKRILRSVIQNLKRDLQRVRQYRQLYRTKRAEMQLPVVALVGYTNAGKSTLMNRLSNANVLAEDKLFATLDPITRRIQLSSGKVILLSDTVGFIQKLPTQLVAAFRATLEEMSDASILMHVIDVSHPNAKAQAKAVHQLLDELDLGDIPTVHVLNKIDMVEEPDVLKEIALSQPNTVCISSKSGEGILEMLQMLEDVLSQQLVEVEAMLPYSEGDILGELRSVGVVSSIKYTPDGTHVHAHVPQSMSKKLFNRGFGKHHVPESLPSKNVPFTWTAQKLH